MAIRVAVVGTGYVGLVYSVGLADFGNSVIGADVNAHIIARLAEGEPTICENGLAEYLRRNLAAGRLTFTADVGEAIRSADTIMIAVGTPQGSDGTADLSQVYAVADAIAENTDGPKVVVVKSTVPVGTNRDILARILKINPHADLAVVSNPEFLREGRAIQDFFHPDRIVIGYDAAGGRAARARETIERLYRPLYLISTPFVWCEPETAELTKYASNAFLAAKITFMNQIANLAEVVGADVHLVARAMGMDGRIGPKFLHPGPGYGGSCFPKDTRALAALADSRGVDLSLVKEVTRANEAQKKRVVTRLKSMLNAEGKRDHSDIRVAVLGLSFKAETDDVRESPALIVVPELLRSRFRVSVHDPKGGHNFRKLVGDSVVYAENEFQAISGVDALVILTEWNEYRNLDLELAASIMRGKVILDTRNVLDPTAAAAMGFRYAGWGRGIAGDR